MSLESGRLAQAPASESFRSQFMTLVRSWPTLVAAVLLGVGVAFAVNYTATPIYEARLTFFVSTSSEQGNNALQADQFAQRRINSYVGVVNSERMASRVATDLRLDLPLGDISGMLNATADPETVLLNVTVRGADSELVDAVAGSVARNLDQVIGELDNRGEATHVELRVISGPTLNPTPVSPRRLLNLGLGMVFGAGLGVVVALLRAQLDTSFRSPSRLAQIAGLPTLAALVADRDSRRRPILEAAEARSRRAEQYRQLRTNLRFVNAASPVRVLVVTSATESEGKTTIATNLAITFARSQTRTLLIDADLRRPTVGDRLGLESAAGLTSVLVGDADLKSVVQEWGPDGLSVLPCGPLPPNPSELLGSAAMRALVDEVRETYDMVIIDTPPVVPVTDGVVTALLADGALLVVRYGRTTRDSLQKSLTSLHSVGARLLGTALSMVPSGGAHSVESSYYGGKRFDKAG